MGIQRETVAAWEGGTSPLSPQNDFILRALLFGARRTGTETFAAHVLTRALGAVHIPGKTPSTPEPFVIAEQLKNIRNLAAPYHEKGDVPVPPP